MIDASRAQDAATRRQRELEQLLRFLCVEVQAADPDHPLLDEGSIRAAIGTGTIASPETRRVLTALSEAHRVLGLAFPPGLLEEPAR